MHKKLKIITSLSLLVAVLALAVAGAGYYLSDKVINVSILRNKIALATQTEAEEQIAAYNIPHTVYITINNQDFELKTSDINLAIDEKATANNALIASRDIKSIFKTKTIKPVLKYDSQKLEEQISLIAGQVYVTPVFPDIKFEEDSPVFSAGKLGYKLNNDLLILEIVSNLEKNNNLISFNLDSIGAVLGESTEQNINEDYKKLTALPAQAGKSIKLYYDRFERVIKSEDLIKLLYGIDGTQDGPFENLLTDLKSIERPAQNAILTEQDGKVTEFAPSKDGIEIRADQLQKDLLKAINDLKSAETSEKSVEIPVKFTEPEIKTGEVNNYGIKELIGRGHSTFKGSIASRTYNVAHAANKINGALIAPGEIFSFNQLIGDISEVTGFKQSYIIKDGQTMLGDGGGVCQVSTTIFRAALESGLEIVERNAHSYRVGYYEQGSPPGIDATIYHPTVDLKFKNNTDNYILVQGIVDTTNKILDFEFYGTKDGRVVEISTPVVSEVIEPPEDLYIDDPTKPVGYIEQIDFKAWGAKAYFDYKVTKNGEVLQEKRFYSNYQPWQAKYIRGTGQ